MFPFRSTKVYDGFSTCFRQWKADGTHCRHLHGYGVSFKITYQGGLDYRNWVMDFGVAKRSNVLIDGKTMQEWFKYMFDHTVIVANGDPALATFIKLDEEGVIQLRTVDQVGAEKFAELIFNKVNEFSVKETQGRVRVVQVEFFEHDKNSAIFRDHNEF